MEVHAGPILLKNYQSEKRINLNRGGTSSGKTGSLLRLALLWLFTGKVDDKEVFTKGVFSIVRKYSANLKTSVQRDWEIILNEQGLMKYLKVNKSDKTYEFNGRIVEFLGIDDPQKARGPRRDILYCNEANELTYEDYFQLSVRTKYKIFIDFNPSDEDSWINVELEQKRQFNEGDVNVFISTYLDNPFLDDVIVKEIQRLEKANPQYWKIYGLGEYGRLDGLIFNYTVIEDLPEEAHLIGYGQDFGFSNDPTALVGVYRYNQGIILDEVIYKTGLINSDISNEYKNAGLSSTDEIFADSAEPKSIEELHRMGWNIKPTMKGKDSILFGIDTMKQYDLILTRRSTNIIKEFRKYIWKVDKEGKSLNEPIDSFNHAIDAVRYLFIMRLSLQNKKKQVRIFTSTINA